MFLFFNEKMETRQKMETQQKMTCFYFFVKKWKRTRKMENGDGGPKMELWKLWVGSWGRGIVVIPPWLCDAYCLTSPCGEPIRNISRTLAPSCQTNIITLLRFRMLAKDGRQTFRRAGGWAFGHGAWWVLLWPPRADLFWIVSSNVPNHWWPVGGPLVRDVPGSWCHHCMVDESRNITNSMNTQ